MAIKSEPLMNCWICGEEIPSPAQASVNADDRCVCQICRQYDEFLKRLLAHAGIGINDPIYF